MYLVYVHSNKNRAFMILPSKIMGGGVRGSNSSPTYALGSSVGTNSQKNFWKSQFCSVYTCIFDFIGQTS